MANNTVDDTEDYIVDTVDLLMKSRGRRSPTLLLAVSINMVPSGLRDLSPSSYDPRVVSIGPLHREDPNVQAYEKHKGILMHLLLEDLKLPPRETLKECVERVGYFIDQIRQSYAGTNIDRYNDMELTKMMVTDACFILYFIRKLSKSGGKLESVWRGSSIIYDLLLVENQIPFFVLDIIFGYTILKSEPIASLTDLVLYLVKFFNIFQSEITVCNNETSATTDLDHILGFLKNCYHPYTGYSPSQRLATSAIHSTVELDRAGVIFEPYSDENWQLAMEFQPSRSAWPSRFWGKPTLKMPVLRIDNFTELVLRNLIAYEQYFGSSTYVTSYAMAMGMMIDTEQDIAKLIESKVIVNHLGSNEKAAHAVGSLCKELPILNFCYADEWEQLDARYNSYWPKNIAALKRTYFNSPWSIIALVVGIALFALTVVQTMYTVNPA